MHSVDIENQGEFALVHGLSSQDDDYLVPGGAVEGGVLIEESFKGKSAFVR